MVVLELLRGAVGDGDVGGDGSPAGGDDGTYGTGSSGTGDSGTGSSGMGVSGTGSSGMGDSGTGSKRSFQVGNAILVRVHLTVLVELGRVCPGCGLEQ